MANEVERRVIRARILGVIAQLEEKVSNLDMDERSNWHSSLLEVFPIVSKVESMILNAMNAEVVERRQKRR